MLNRRTLFAGALAVLLLPRMVKASHVCLFERDPERWQFKCTCGATRPYGRVIDADSPSFWIVSKCNYVHIENQFCGKADGKLIRYTTPWSRA